MHGMRMLDAYISTYPDTFGSVTFEECCNKYNVQYWTDEQLQLQVPTMDLYGCSYSVAKAILEYVFERAECI